MHSPSMLYALVQASVDYGPTDMAQCHQSVYSSPDPEGLRAALVQGNLIGVEDSGSLLSWVEMLFLVHKEWSKTQCIVRRSGGVSQSCPVLSSKRTYKLKE